MNSKCGLEGSNGAELKKNFSNNSSSSCFVLAVGFSAVDKDQDSNNDHGAKGYGSAGRWCASCLHHNPHCQTGNEEHFASHVKVDPQSSCWAWWGR
jgi:hypothetical protein